MEAQPEWRTTIDDPNQLGRGAVQRGQADGSSGNGGLRLRPNSFAIAGLTGIFGIVLKSN